MGGADFDPAALHTLIDRALGPREAPAPVPARTGAGFAAGMGPVFGYLATELEAVVAGDVAQAVLSGVRDRVLADRARIDLPTVHALVRACRACPDMNGAPALPAGNLADPDVVVVTELAPRAGRMDPGVGEALTAAGFGPGRVAQTSVVRCGPAGVRPVTPLEHRSCSERYLFNELALLTPRLIVTMGTIAAEAVTQGAITMSEDRGQLLWCGPWAILCTYAVGYTARRPGAAEALAADLRQAYAFCYGSP